MKQTIVAIIPTETIIKPDLLNNNAFIEIAKTNGEIINIEEFNRRYNYDELNFSKTYIRILEAELEVKCCK